MILTSNTDYMSEQY